MEDFDLGSIGHSKDKPTGRLHDRSVAQGGRVGEERWGRGRGLFLSSSRFLFHSVNCGRESGLFMSSLISFSCLFLCLSDFAVPSLPVTSLPSSHL